jgi:diacylglycerol kinase (ATP)
MTPKTLIILNPTAGKGFAGRKKSEIAEYLQSIGVNFDLVETERPGHAIELAGRAVADHYDLVIAAGGDGTSNEVINGLMLAKRAGVGSATMGVLPVGRGNDFAYSMFIPTDWKKAADLLVDPPHKPLDIGFVVSDYFPEGRYFGNGVGVGFDAVVGFVAARSKLSGIMSYLVAAIKTIYIFYTAPKVRVELDDKVLTLNTLMVSIMNGRRMGGSFQMTPDSKCDDGLFDLCIAGEVSRGKIFAMIPKFMNGSQGKDPAVQFARSRNVTVTAVEGSLPAHADGETLCVEGQRLVIELLPSQFDLITPGA